MIAALISRIFPLEFFGRELTAVRFNPKVPGWPFFRIHVRDEQNGIVLELRVTPDRGLLYRRACCVTRDVGQAGPECDERFHECHARHSGQGR
jgi:hypothetical protein